MRNEITIKIENCESKNLKVENTERIQLDKPSMYAKIFNESNPYWEKDPEWNKMFLAAQQRYCNDMLEAKGYLLLNDVYDLLGFPRTKAGAIVGWVYDIENPVGDNYIDFGIFEDYNSEFVNGNNNTVVLDFNVDGIVLDRLQD